MQLWKSMVTALVAFIPSALSAEVIPGSSFGYGNWQGAGYTDQQTGVFSHCAVSADYVSGNRLLFSLGRDGEIGVGVSSPALRLEPGANFPVAIKVDRRAPYYGTAVAISENHAAVFIDELDSALNAFRRGYTLVIEGVSLRGEYDLSGTFRALERMTDCAIQNYAYASAPAKGAQPAATAAFDQSILYQVATQTITSFGISNFTFSSTDELIALGLTENTVRWIAPDSGVTGTILALPMEVGETLRDGDAGDTQFLANQCADEYVTSARNITEADFTIREIRVMCAGGEQVTEHYLNKFRVGDYALYTWFEFVPGAAAPSGETTQQRSANASIVAAAFLLD